MKPSIYFQDCTNKGYSLEIIISIMRTDIEKIFLFKYIV